MIVRVLPVLAKAIENGLKLQAIVNTHQYVSVTISDLASPDDK